MQDLSLNILDITQNSIKAGATLIEIDVLFSGSQLAIEIRDNGCGMDAETVKRVVDPFYTTRTTRKVGLGVPFFKMVSEMTGGSFHISSQVGTGTVIGATFETDHVDCLPLGDINETIWVLVSGNPDIDFVYTYGEGEKSFTLDTREIKQIMEGVPINHPQVTQFLAEYLRENTEEVHGGV